MKNFFNKIREVLEKYNGGILWTSCVLWFYFFWLTPYKDIGSIAQIGFLPFWFSSGVQSYMGKWKWPVIVLITFNVLQGIAGLIFKV
jgi:hypothetical protein